VKVAPAAFRVKTWSRMRPIDRGSLLESQLHARSWTSRRAGDARVGPRVKAWRTRKLLDLPSTVDVFRYMGGWCTKLTGKAVPVSLMGGNTREHTREPVGRVRRAITPWNIPWRWLLEDRLRHCRRLPAVGVIQASEIRPLPEHAAPRRVVHGGGPARKES